MYNTQTIEITKRCPFCGESKTFVLYAEDVEKWKQGALIQSVWPFMPANDRETLMTAICPECWDKEFGDK